MPTKRAPKGIRSYRVGNTLTFNAFSNKRKFDQAVARTPGRRVSPEEFLYGGTSLSVKSSPKKKPFAAHAHLTDISRYELRHEMQHALQSRFHKLMKFPFYFEGGLAVLGEKVFFPLLEDAKYYREMRENKRGLFPTVTFTEMRRFIHEKGNPHNYSLQWHHYLARIFPTRKDLSEALEALFKDKHMRKHLWAIEKEHGQPQHFIAILAFFEAYSKRKGWKVD